MKASTRRGAALATALVVSVVVAGWLLVAVTVDRSLNGGPLSVPALLLTLAALAVFPVTLVWQRRTPLAWVLGGWFLLSGAAVGLAVLAA